MLPVRLRPAALAELTEAWRWYEAQRDGLGDEFRAVPGQSRPEAVEPAAA